MGRKILLITTDQQRFDALGCNGGKHARTPVADSLAASGLNYTQARNQNVVCMPERATILTGQYIRSHGVVSNGIPLPEDSTGIAGLLNDAGYKTALIGKGHFEPAAGKDFFENRAAREGSTGPHRGFDHMELAAHTGREGRSLYHYPKWLAETYPDEIDGFHVYSSPVGPVNIGGGETGAVQVAINPIPTAHYHTDWVADRTIAWLDTLAAEDDWFVWMSFPDPHHPWDPPADELHRCPWRDLPVPEGYPGSREKTVEVLRRKPRHWLDWYEGRSRFNFEVPPGFVPAELTTDQLREVDAMIHVENELIDEAVGRVLDRIDARGWDADTDVFFTTDHGEFQGDFGMLFKGPYHVDALMRLPFIWRPAPSANVTPAVVDAPVGHVDLAPTMAAIAGINQPDAMQGAPLPTTAAANGRERTITEWDDEFDGHRIVVNTLYRDGWICTAYGATDYYDGSEGELYNLANDPRQWENLWDDPDYRGIRKDLVADLHDNLPPARPDPLEKVAPV